MEIIDLYDKDRQALNETAERGSELPKGRYRLVVHLCIFNDNDEMLIQKRQTTKELGIHIDMSDMRPKFTMNFRSGFDDVYLIRENVDIDTVRLQEEEVQAVRWVMKRKYLI